MKYLTKSVLKQAPRKKTSHKGDFGRVLVIAGSEDYAGAALLTSTACRAILHAGADLTIVCCPEKISWLINTRIPETITKRFKGKRFSAKDVPKILKLAKEADVVLIGPGLSRKSIPFAKKIVEKYNGLKVIDADAIHGSDIRKVQNAIFTPHANEFKVLLKNSKLNESNFQKSLGNNVVLLKGNVDKIISKNKIAYNKTGNSIMTKGGTGDVLAGLSAGFLAQGNDLFKSACMAAYLNGAVGDYLLKRQKTFLASDIVYNLGKYI